MDGNRSKVGSTITGGYVLPECFTNAPLKENIRMATETSTMTYTFARYVQGVLVDYVQADAVSIQDAVAQLSEQWAGVFKYSSHIRKDV